MINSAQALNESFQGLQRVQERLADKLDYNQTSTRGRFVVIAVALLLLVAVGGILTWRLIDSATARRPAGMGIGGRQRPAVGRAGTGRPPACPSTMAMGGRKRWLMGFNRSATDVSLACTGDDRLFLGLLGFLDK